MSSSSPLIQRLQAQRSSASRMLVPGLKQARSAGMSPILDGIGREKFTRIVESMRILQPQRLGQFRPGAEDVLGSTLTEKFKNNSNLLHIKPGGQNARPWSEVEQVYPVQGEAAPSAAQEAAQPGGIMRAGSIIQRMPTTPQPGQSIEAFKAMVQGRQSTPPPPAPAAKPKPIPANMRRYSRVDELNSNKKNAEITANTPSSPAADAPATAPTSTDSKPSNTVQRQVEATPENHPDEEKSTPSTAIVKDAQPAERTATSVDTPLAKISFKEQPQTTRPATEQPSPQTPALAKADTPKLPQAEQSPDAASPITTAPKIPAPKASAAPSPKKEQAETAGKLPLAPPAKKSTSPKRAADKPRAVPTQPVRNAKNQQQPTLPVTKPATIVQRQANNDSREKTPVAQPVQKSEPRISHAETDKLPLPMEVSVKQQAAASETAPEPAESEQASPVIHKPVKAADAPAVQPTSTIAPSTEQEQLPLKQMSPSSGLPAMTQAVVTSTDPATAEPAPQNSESAPLFVHLSKRRSAPEQVRFVSPKQVLRPTTAKPIIAPSITQKPLVTRQITSSNIVSRQLDEPTASLPPLRAFGQQTPTEQALQAQTQFSRPPQPNSPQTRQQNRSNPPVPQNSTSPVLEMPVVHRPEAPQAPSQSVAAASQPATPQLPAALAAAAPVPQNAAQAALNAVPTTSKAAGGVIQRMWEEHKEFNRSATGQRASKEEQSEAQQADIDLDQLAKDVFPLVKRLIEIESERR